MEAPKCKVCGTRHYGLCPVAAGIPVQSTAKETQTRLDPDFPREKIGFDRKAYQKEYMREYRRKHKTVPK